jgi:hypothetical protein
MFYGDGQVSIKVLSPFLRFTELNRKYVVCFACFADRGLYPYLVPFMFRKLNCGPANLSLCHKFPGLDRNTQHTKKVRHDTIFNYPLRFATPTGRLVETVLVRLQLLQTVGTHSTGERGQADLTSQNSGKAKRKTDTLLGSHTGSLSIGRNNTQEEDKN